MLHPEAPPFVEPSGPQDGQQAFPVNGVEGLAKINLKDNGRGFPNVAAPEEVRGIDNVFRDTPPREEASLISIHQCLNDRLEPGG
jgi:hypothetical protein